jgi:hypothetical protein
MATERAIIGIGLDLDQIQVQLASLPKVASKEAGRAAKELDQIARKTSAAITKVAKQQARAARERSRAEIRVAAILRDAEGERQTASEKAVAWMEREIQKLDTLQRKGAEAAQVERARAAVMATARKRIAAATADTAAAARPVAGAAAGFDALADAQGRAAVSGRELGFAAQSVAQQLPDVVSQLSAGAPAAQVFAQQGLQVVQVNMGLLAKAARGLIGVLSGPWGIAVAAGVAAASALAGAIQQDRLESEAFRAALESTERALNVGAITGYTDAVQSMAQVVATATEALYLETGALDSLDVAQMRAVESTRESARAVLLEAAAIGARLEVQRQAIEARIASGELSYSEAEAAFARLAVIQKELPVARQRLQQVKDEVAASVERVNATYNEISAEEDAKDSALAASKARQSASKASTRAAREAAREAEKAADRAAAAFEREAQAVLFLVDAAQRLDAEREIMAQAAAGPSASQIAGWRDLGSAVENLVPQAAMDRGTQLVLLLDQLEYAAAQSGAASRALAEDIGRVETAIAVEAAEAWIAEIDAAEVATSEAGDSIAASMRKIGGAVDSLTGGAGPLAGLVGGLFDADRMAERMLGRAKEAAEMAGQPFGPDQAEEAADSAAAIASAVGGAAAMAAPFLDEIAKGAKGGEAVAEMAVSFIDGIAKGIGPFVSALVQAIPEIVASLALAGPEIVAGIIASIPEMAKGLALAWVDALERIWRRVRRLFGDMFREIATGGAAKTRTFGDTPGPVRVSDGSMTARFAGGDIVAAARSMEGLRAQVGASPAAPAQPAVVTIDVRDGPVQLGISRATSRAVARSGVGRDTTGRRSPYARL